MVRACRLTRITVGDVGLLLALVVGALRQGCLSTVLIALEIVGWDVPKILANACCDAVNNDWDFDRITESIKKL